MKITNISDVRRWFHCNQRSIYFISATNFNLAGIHEWVRRFKHICYIDCYDGRYPNVFTPSKKLHPQFESIEDINNYLLEHKEVIDYIKQRAGDPVAVFLMFDQKTEELCEELGIEIWFPPASCGTIVGPLLTEIIGHKKLTPYKGGWCGNEIFPVVAVL